MFSTDGILGRSFAISSAALDGLSKRMEVHAENLANINTDGYRAKTLDFEDSLKAAMSGEDPGMRYSNPFATGGSGATSGAADGASLASTFRVGTTGDGVNRVAETNAMVQDNIRFRVLSQSVTNDLSQIRSVIAEMGRG